ncbi:MAG: hypothetical protein L6408_09775 [Nanoarchaeota archaeon]|nr:hypothetical protein [Nanoarchaeota archaeon]
MEKLSKKFADSLLTLGCYFFLQTLVVLFCPPIAYEVVTTITPQMHPLIIPFVSWGVGTWTSVILSKNFSEVLIKEMPIMGNIVSHLWGLASLLLALLSFRNCF